MKKSKMARLHIAGFAALAVMVFVVAAVAFFPTAKTTRPEITKTVLPEITVYKESSCGCCSLWIKYLDSPTKIVEQEDLTALKEQFGIPQDMQSCHTATIGKYFIEGHVPREAIEKLVAEQPDIDGIAMPGMPSGSPGMGGTKQGDFVIYAIKDGAVHEYMRI